MLGARNDAITRAYMQQGLHASPYVRRRLRPAFKSGRPGGDFVGADWRLGVRAAGQSTPATGGGQEEAADDLRLRAHTVREPSDPVVAHALAHAERCVCTVDRLTVRGAIINPCSRQDTMLGQHRAVALGEEAPLLPSQSSQVSPQLRLDLQRRSSCASASTSSRSTSDSSISARGDSAPSYPYLILSHVIGLIPSITLLLGFAALTLRIPCHLPLVADNNGNDANERSQARCSALLGPGSWLSWSLYLLAIASYAAAHKVRNLISRFCSLTLRIVRVSFLGLGSELETRYDVLAKDDDDAATTIFAFVSRALFTEAFKIMLIVAASGLVLGKTYVDSLNAGGQAQSSASDELLVGERLSTAATHRVADSIRFSKLDPIDGRFRIAVWLICGWTTTELLSATIQLFRQLAMYAPLYGPAEDAHGMPDTEHSELGDAETPTPHVDHTYAEHRFADPERQFAPSSRDPEDGESSIYRGLQGSTRPVGGSDVAERQRATLSVHRAHQLEDSGRSTPKSTLAKARQRIQRMISHPRSDSVAQRLPEHADAGEHNDYFGDVARVHDMLPPGPRSGTSQDQSTISVMAEENAVARLESQIDRLVAARTRVRLEQSLGARLPDLSVLLAGLWRLDHVLWSIGSLLLLSSAVALGQGEHLFEPAPRPHGVAFEALGRGSRHHGQLPPAQLFPRLDAIALSFTTVAVLYAVINSVWKLALASWMVTYPSLLVGLGLLVGGLARWGLIV
ncbi:unnamed protein product [Parajaminaea phylloscopi]